MPGLHGTALVELSWRASAIPSSAGHEYADITGRSTGLGKLVLLSERDSRLEIPRAKIASGFGKIAAPLPLLAEIVVAEHARRGGVSRHLSVVRLDLRAASVNSAA